MAEDRFLIVRLGSLGDIIHTLPAAAALRDSCPGARVDWVVESKWLPLLAGNPDLNQVIAMDRDSWGAMWRCVARLRQGRYTCVLDFQGLYKSAVLAWCSGAPKRIGWAREYVRDGPATLLYSLRVTPAGRHKVEHNLTLAASAVSSALPAGRQAAAGYGAGVRPPAVRFPVQVSPEAEAQVAHLLATQGLREYFVISPGGGWQSKCWPAERYGRLHRQIVERYGLGGVVSFGPGERALAEAVRAAAGAPATLRSAALALSGVEGADSGPAAGLPEPLVMAMDLPQLVAALRGARFVVGGDTGPLHLAVALGTPVVGLYGPTDPARNGPYSSADVVVRNARAEETTYKRGDRYSPSMLSITVEQVLAAVEQRMGWG